MLKKEQKQEIVKELAAKIKKQNFAFFNFEKVPSEEMVQLRRQAKDKNLECKVLKRRLIEKALSEVKIESELPQGCYLAVTSSKDEIGPFKFIAQFIKEKELGHFQGGIFEHSFISASQAEKIANLPSKEESKAQLIYVLKSPLQKLHYNLSYNLIGLINILKQKAEAKT